MEQDYVDDGRGEPATRREFIRRGALVLGMTAWAAPVVQMVRSRGGGSPSPGPAPEEIGVQQITAACTTCEVGCGSVTECGTAGIFVCFCAPSATTYPISECVCATEVICEDAIPCSDGCPPGWACAQGCCDVPVCLPPCPDEPAPLAAAGARSSGSRLTVTGRRV